MAATPSPTLDTVDASPTPGSANEAAPAATPAIEAHGIDKRFGATEAVRGAELTVARGEMVGLLGPSGSGKSTLLRILAGFETPDHGTVAIGGRPVVGPGTWVEPEARRIGMVFQDGALFPHLTVAANVGFGEPAPGRVAECLGLVGLANRGDAYPHELSGGERQRIALARALATEPDVVLLDEPFAALDATLRESLRDEVAAILRAAGASALFVTHDQQEALSLVDRVVLLDGGAVAQDGTPQDVYRRPATAWVATFLGGAEILDGTASHGTAVTELGDFTCDPGLAGPVQVVVRPEAVRASAVSGADAQGADAAASRGVIRARAYYGHDQVVSIELETGRVLRSRCGGADRWDLGTPVAVRIEGPVHVIPGR